MFDVNSIPTKDEPCGESVTTVFAFSAASRSARLEVHAGEPPEAPFRLIEVFVIFRLHDRPMRALYSERLASRNGKSTLARVVKPHHQ
jgi:hypothetical protein